MLPKPVPKQDLVNYILEGLGPQFESFVKAISTRRTLISLYHLTGMLNSHEYPIEQANATVVTTNIASRNTSTKQDHHTYDSHRCTKTSYYNTSGSQAKGGYSQDKGNLVTLLTSPKSNVKSAANLFICLLNATIDLTMPTHPKKHVRFQLC